MVGPGMFNGLFSGLLIIVAIVAGLFFLGGWMLGKRQYKEGYIQGQIDYRNGIIRLDTDTTYKIKLK